MKTYEFGKKFYELRKAKNLTQKELASMLNLTNKAISKWENGDALPSVTQVVALAKIFNTTTDELLNNNVKTDKQIYKIAITGGPCAGKSTALSWLQDAFTKKGYMVLFVPETPTELMLGGISYQTMGSALDFQASIVKLQYEKEKLYMEAAEKMKNHNKVLVICDRGILDGKAYCSNYEFNQILQKLNLNEVSVRDSYDAVFHLVTAAKGAEEFYTLANNKARFENAEEARIADNKTLNAWVGHPHLRVIDNSTDFEHKMIRLINEISSILNEPKHYEIERKFLIAYPNLEALEKNASCQKVEIIQTYLRPQVDAEMRIRQRGQNGFYTYTKTIKQKVSAMKRVETETRITQAEYVNLLLEADPNLNPIRKTRYCLTYKNQYFEIDVYPFWKDKAIMEIELRDEQQKIDFPKYINIIKEVTNDEEFLNYNLAKHK